MPANRIIRKQTTHYQPQQAHMLKTPHNTHKHWSTFKLQHLNNHQNCTGSDLKKYFTLDITILLSCESLNAPLLSSFITFLQCLVTVSQNDGDAQQASLVGRCDRQTGGEKLVGTRMLLPGSGTTRRVRSGWCARTAPANY